MRTGIRLTRTAGAGALALTALLAAACDKVPLMAPTNSTVTVSASARTLPMGGSTEISAFVAESAGTPVQNGTTVRFTTNLGRVDPVEAQTRNGTAVTTFFAGSVSGIADVKATSGSIGNATGTGTAANAVQILVGTAAVDSVTLGASSGSVPATGGTVDLTASVLGAGSTITNGGSVGGGPLAGVPVSFTTTAGALSSSVVTTDASGTAKTALTMDSQDATATVTASAGTKTATVTVTRRAALPTPTVTFTATGGTPIGGAQLWSFAATLSGLDSTVTARDFTWDFGDEVVVTTNSPSTSHVYTVSRKTYTVTLRVTLSNGQTITAVNQIITGIF